MPVSQVSRRETFQPDGYSGTMFRSTERQQIIDHLIRSKIKGPLYYCITLYVPSARTVLYPTGHVLHCTVPYLSCTVLYCTVLYPTCHVLHCTVLYSTCHVLHCTVPYRSCTALYLSCTVLHSTCHARHCWTILYSAV